MTKDTSGLGGCQQKISRSRASDPKRDDSGEYWLITPAERGRILVDDAPFTAVE